VFQKNAARAGVGDRHFGERCTLIWHFDSPLFLSFASLLEQARCQVIFFVIAVDYALSYKSHNLLLL
jgi:hypothetical protein